MATPSRRTTPRFLAVLLVTFGLLLPLTGAGADPGTSSRDARRELEQLNVRVDRAVEDFADVRIELAAAEKRAASAQARVRKAEAELRVLQAQVGDFAAAAYMSGGQDEFVQLLTTSSPQTFLDRAASLDRIASGREARIQQVRALRRQLVAEQQAAGRVLDTQRALARRLASIRHGIEEQVARQEALLGRLESAEARARRLEQQRREARASRERVAVAYTGPATGRAAIAVREAYRQLGKPYRWGAAGPNSFDCSGLTMWVWGKAGVSLPHSSRAQFRYGVRVSRSELRPGDLVFYGSPIHHVGIYVGNGRYIAAPRTGDVVGFRNVDRGDWAGAVRL